MFVLIRVVSSFAVIGFCFLTSCGQASETNKLIAEINAVKAKARTIANEAESKRAKAEEKTEAGDRSGVNSLIEEAAKLYGQISELLHQAADKADQIVNLKNPEWYREYFRLHSKLIRSLAQMASSAHEELLLKSGEPSESQLKSWKENISRVGKENQELRRQIAAIEARHGVVLINE